MSKGSDQFKDTIQRYLHQQGQIDPLVAEGLKKPGKNIDDCIAYILNTVQKSNKQGFTDDEVYGIALHYYDENDLGDIKKIKADVRVNHVVELSEQEKETLIEQARNQLINETKEKMKTKKSSSLTKVETDQASLF